jgi:hypothetical protein
MTLTKVNASQCNTSHHYHYQEHITLTLTFIHILLLTNGTSPPYHHITHIPSIHDSDLLCPDDESPYGNLFDGEV